MKFLPMAPGAAFAALFLVAGCGGAPRDSTAAAPQQKGAELARADVARPPAIPDEATVAEAAPLNEAGEIASEISSNTMIERVPVEGGLAWREDGQVVRTASDDGQRIAYFHPGEDRPFFVQKEGLAFAYRDGQAQRAYDSDGRPRPVSDAARAEAARLADQSRREREAAERAPTADGDRRE
jgi:hypothetical protein